MVLNSSRIYDPETVALRKELEEKYDVPVQVMDVLNMKEEDITNVFHRVLKEFPVKEINIDMPEWIEKLDCKHWLKVNFLNLVKDLCKNIYKVRDINKSMEGFRDVEFLELSNLKEMNMGEGTARLELGPKPDLFYRVLSETCGCDIRGENELLSIMQDL